MSDDLHLTAHYVLNVTTVNPGEFTRSDAKEPAKFYSSYEDVLFEPDISLGPLDTRRAVEALADRSVLECEKMGLFEILATIYSTNEMTQGSDDYLVVQGKRIDITDLEDRLAEGEDLSWDFFESAVVDSVEVVEGPLITASGVDLLVEKSSPTEILRVLPVGHDKQQETPPSNKGQSVWARLWRRS